VSSGITGASGTSQVVEDTRAILLSDRLTPDVLARIETILHNAPEAEDDFRDG